jgi:hypothetical protein
MAELKLPTREDLRDEFWKLRDEIDAIDAARAPLREARDAWINAEQAKIAARDAELMAEIRDVEKGLHAKKMRLSRLAEMTGNNPGPRPEAAPQAEAVAEG